MGLFSDKKETKVSTSVVRIMEDSFLPNSIKTGMNRGIFEGQDFMSNILEELVGGIGIKAERMRKYALKNYPTGVPKLGLTNTIQQSAVGEAYIKSVYPDAVVEYSYFGSSNLNHVAWESLVSVLEYNPNTNELVGLTKSTGYKTYLSEFQLVLPQDTVNNLSVDSLKFLGASSTAGYTPSRPYTLSVGTDQYSTQKAVLASGVEERLRVTYEYKKGLVGTSEIVQETIEIPLKETSDSDDYYQLKFRSGGVVRYWSYMKYAGEIPPLDSDKEPSDEYGNFYPNIYFRYNKLSLGHSNLEQEFIAATKMCNLVGISFYDMTQQIESNPDIENLDNAFLTFAVSPNTDEPVAQKYLFEFFNRILERSSSVSGKPLSAIDALLGKYSTEPTSRSGQAIQIKDKKFTMSLSHGGLTRFTGLSVGVAGSYSSGFASKNKTTQYYVMENGVQVSKTKTQPTDYYWYRKQVTPTTYEEIHVLDLRMTYFVKGKHTTVGDDKSSLLLVPIDEAVIRSFTLSEKERLYGLSMHMVFNSWVTYTVSWFQTGIFKTFMMIVAVVMIVFTYGASLQALGTALAVGGAVASAALMTMFVGALKAMVVSVAIKLFVKEFGPELAMLLAVVAVAYGMSGAMSNSSWAENLLSVGNGLIKETSAFYTDAMKELQSEFIEFTAYTEDMYEQLEAASKELQESSYLSPHVVFGESPDNFYSRTVHSGNIGVQSIAAISNYVDVALTLPSFNDSVQNNFT